MKNQKNTLTAEQTATFNILVQLGDSEQLALETVLGMTPRTKEEMEFYNNAYRN
jgi:hypothetical protein